MSRSGCRAGFSFLPLWKREFSLWKKQACNFTSHLFCTDHYPNGIFHTFGLDILFFGVNHTIWNVSFTLGPKTLALFSGHGLPWSLTGFCLTALVLYLLFLKSVWCVSHLNSWGKWSTLWMSLFGITGSFTSGKTSSRIKLVMHTIASDSEGNCSNGIVVFGTASG